MCHTLNQFKSRKELLNSLIKDLDESLEKEEVLAESFFGQNLEAKEKYEATKWLKGILTSKLDYVESSIKHLKN